MNHALILFLFVQKILRNRAEHSHAALRTNGVA